jgi:hypothetical protein
MSGSIHDAMSPRVIAVALAPAPRPRLLWFSIGSGRRSPCMWTTSPIVLAHIVLFGLMMALLIFRRRSWMYVVGAVQGRDLRLEFSRIRFGAS